MKKLVAGAAVAALLGSAAFADVNVGASGNNVAAIGNKVNNAGDGTDVGISNTTNWQSYGTRNGISFNASNDYIGFNAQINQNGDKFEWDNGYIWYSPLEQLKVWVGKGTGDDIRGDACYSTWDLYRIGTMTGGYHEAWTFQGQDSTGAKIGVFPIEGLKIFASFNYDFSKGLNKTTTINSYSYTDDDGNTYKSGSATEVALGNADFDEADVKEIAGYYFYNGNLLEANESSSYNSGVNNLAEVVGRKSKYALAYSIGGDEGIATIKLGLDTTPPRVLVKDGDDKKVKDQNIINAAVDLRPMENLFISVGAFIPMVQKKVNLTESYAEKDWVEDSVANRANLYVKFGAMEGLNIHAQFGTKINGAYEKKDGSSTEHKKNGGFGFLFAGGVDYALMDDLTLYADVGYADGVYWSGSTADHSDCLNFGLGVTKSYDACAVSAGFVGATNGNGMYKTTYTDDNGDTKYPFSWGIPLRVSYSF